MRLDFEEWISKQQIPFAAKQSFDESFICYKNGTYRAAYLFSFIAFDLIIKDRVLSAKAPDGISTRKWTEITNKLDDDETWDTEVLEVIKREQPTAIFRLNTDLRTQYSYWRYRRNDCAHFKNNEITNSHVEAFWYFIKCNLQNSGWAKVIKP